MRKYGHSRCHDTDVVTGYGRQAGRGRARAASRGGPRVRTHIPAYIGARPTANSFAGSQQERVAADIHSVSANLTEGEHTHIDTTVINPTVVGESVCGNGRGKAQPGSGRGLSREDGARRHRGHHHEHQLREGKGRIATEATEETVRDREIRPRRVVQCRSIPAPFRGAASLFTDLLPP